jgi:hypothetical protein
MMATPSARPSNLPAPGQAMSSLPMMAMVKPSPPTTTSKMPMVCMSPFLGQTRAGESPALVGRLLYNNDRQREVCMLLSSSRQVHLVGLIGALALVGCGSGGRKPPGGAGTGYASFTWRVFDPAGYEYQTCSEVGLGALTVTLIDQVTGSEYPTANVVCDDMAAYTVAVPTGNYSVRFEAFGDPLIYGNATTKLDDFFITDVNSGELAVFPIYAGLNDYTLDYAVVVFRSFFVGWSFASGPASLMCAQVGASFVDLDVYTSAGSTPVTSRFDCAAGQGISFPYPYGPATAQWQLFLVDAAEVEITHIDGGSVSLPPMTANATDVSLGTTWSFSY